MRRAGSDLGARAAGLVLVALLAALFLPRGPAVPRDADRHPAGRAQVVRRQVDAPPVAARRPLVLRYATVPSSSFVIAALTLIGLLALIGSGRPAWSPRPHPVPRGPPSSR